MVKATNAGGMTQSMADLLIGEAGPTENYSTITNYHDKIQSATYTVRHLGFLQQIKLLLIFLIQLYSF